MHAELANLHDGAVSFLSRAAINLSWYDSTCRDNDRVTYHKF